MGKCDGERDVPDAVFPLAVFLSDTLRDIPDCIPCMAFPKKCFARGHNYTQ
jgi:hypothetical protein